MTLRIASYNLHKCVGTDRKHDPARVVNVINALHADVIALQEVDKRMGERPAALPQKLIEEETDFIRHDMPRTTAASLGWHGQVVLVRRGSRVLGVEPVSLPGLEPRGAIAVNIAPDSGAPFLLIAAHLGLRRTDRRAQWARIAEIMAGVKPHPALAIGDFNEWRARHGFEALTGFHIHAPGATYPSRAPIGRLDRIVTSPGLRVVRKGVLDTPLARVASDHLPIWADIGGIVTRAHPRA